MPSGIRKGNDAVDRGAGDERREASGKARGRPSERLVAARQPDVDGVRARSRPAARLGPEPPGEGSGVRGGGFGEAQLARRPKRPRAVLGNDSAREEGEVARGRRTGAESDATNAARPPRLISSTTAARMASLSRGVAGSRIGEGRELQRKEKGAGAGHRATGGRSAPRPEVVGQNTEEKGEKNGEREDVPGQLRVGDLGENDLEEGEKGDEPDASVATGARRKGEDERGGIEREERSRPRKRHGRAWIVEKAFGAEGRRAGREVHERGERMRDLGRVREPERERHGERREGPKGSFPRRPPRIASGEPTPDRSLGGERRREPEREKDAVVRPGEVRREDGEAEEDGTPPVDVEKERERKEREGEKLEEGRPRELRGERRKEEAEARDEGGECPARAKGGEGEKTRGRGVRGEAAHPGDLRRGPENQEEEAAVERMERGPVDRPVGVVSDPEKIPCAKLCRRPKAVERVEPLVPVERPGRGDHPRVDDERECDRRREDGEKCQNAGSEQAHGTDGGFVHLRPGWRRTIPVKILPAPGPSRRQDGRSGVDAVQRPDAVVRSARTPRARRVAALNAATSTVARSSRPPRIASAGTSTPRYALRSAATTSGPTSYRSREIDGPNAAWRLSGLTPRAARASSAASRTRAAVPRQPAWTAAIQPVTGSARTTGTQSAEATRGGRSAGRSRGRRLLRGGCARAFARVLRRKECCGRAPAPT